VEKELSLNLLDQGGTKP